MGDRARLNATIRGIDVDLDVDGHDVKAVITANLLRERYQAADTPQGWLDAYRAHAASIDELVRSRFRLDATQEVVVIDDARGGGHTSSQNDPVG